MNAYRGPKHVLARSETQNKLLSYEKNRFASLANNFLYAFCGTIKFNDLAKSRQNDGFVKSSPATGGARRA
jgi:hypothetical protein